MHLLALDDNPRLQDYDALRCNDVYAPISARKDSHLLGANMQLTQMFRRSPMLVMFVFLSACGGGGGGDSSGGNGGGGSTTYTVGGTITGLTGTVVLQNNGGDNLTRNTNDSFTFSTALTNNASYTVTVLTQPTGQTCAIANPSGNVSGANVTNVSVECTSNGGGARQVMEIAIGANHTCARLDNGGVKCWGSSLYGQLGLGNVQHRGDGINEMGNNLPYVNLGTGRTAVQLALGYWHSCARLDNGSVKCWGYNASGQLGIGDNANRGDNANEMGDNLPAIDLGSGRTALQIGAGGHFTCALLDNAAVKCWGDNTNGRLGLGDTSHRGDTPNEMGDNLAAVDFGAGRSAIDVAIGENHGCARLDNAALKCWGSNIVGQLGLGTSLESRGDAPNEMGDNLPVVGLGTGRTAVQIVAGGLHTCARLDNSTVKCWGSGFNGELGLGDASNRGDGAGEMGDNLPIVDLGAGRTAVDVTANYLHTCARLDNGILKCWGWNLYGQLGLGDTGSRGDGASEMGDNLAAISLGTGRTAVQIAAGYFHTCARLDNGTVKCWGEGTLLGLGNNITRGDNPNEMGDNLPAVDLGN